MSFEFPFVEIDGVPLEILEYPDSDYQAVVRMPSAKFMRICNKLSSFADSGIWTLVRTFYLVIYETSLSARVIRVS